jgi:CelD/BcsL family acetyltransferase involved in cellulose biosynthesis
LERAGAVARCYSGRQNALIEKIYSLKSGQTKSFGENLFRDPLRRAFLCEALALPIMQTRIFTLETTHSLVAAVVSFRDRDIRRFYTTYFDQNWAKFSPGQALLFKAALSSLREGLTCDFMTGEQQYKLRLADEVVPLYRLGPVSLDVLIGREQATAANSHKSFRNVLAA